MKRGDEQVRRAAIEFERRSDLLDAPLVQHHDAVGERHRLYLIVGDVDHRRPRVGVQRGEFEPGLRPQRRIEVRQRLVEQEHLRIAHQRPADGDALALAAGELLRLALEQVGNPEAVRDHCDAGLGFGPGGACEAQAELHVLPHIHVGIERIGLEHHGDAARGRSEIGHVPPADRDGAFARFLEAGDEAQQGRLAAARRADEDDEFAVRHVEAEIGDGLEISEAFRHVAQHDTRPW